MGGVRRHATLFAAKNVGARHPYEDRSAAGYDSDGLWKAGFAAFPQPLENPSGFPQTHSLDDEEISLDSI